jgi:hypothetical protein
MLLWLQINIYGGPLELIQKELGTERSKVTEEQSLLAYFA